MKGKDSKFFSVTIKLGMFILIVAIIMLFFVTPKTAEFYVTIFTIILMVIFIAYAMFVVRREDRHGNKKD